MEKPVLKHAALEHLPTAENELLINGRPLSRIADQVGSTPFYVYDRQLIQARLKTLRDMFPERFHLHYAIKANPMPAVVNFVAPQVDGLDVASALEMQVALNAGVDPSKISFAGPGKSEKELAQAHAAGIVVNIESERELKVLADVARQRGYVAKAAVRVNPDFELKSSGMKMAGGAKQFGIDAEKVPDLLRQWPADQVTFVGFHIFSGSQNLRAESIVESQQKAYALALELAQSAPHPVQHVNIGGGFGIPYFPGETDLDLSPIQENLQALDQRVRKDMPQAHLVIELGRYIIGESGYYVCQVVDRKVSRGQVFLVTNGGLHHHLSASGNFGQVIRKNYPVVIGNRIDGDTKEVVNIVGPLCTPLDVLGDKMLLPVADVGDLVAVLQSGAYGLTASPTRFLSHPQIVEILV